VYRIRRLGVIRTANVVALMYLVLVAIFAIPLGLVFMAAGDSTMPGAQSLQVLGGLLVAVIVPIAYAAVGWIATALACLLYNLVARWIGGIQIQLELEPAAPAPPPGASVPGVPGAPTA
jgi:hypothetical protein